MPDLVIASSVQNNCILIESKGGNNIENDQAQRYKRVKPHDVVSKLHADVVGGHSPSVDISYLCFSESTDDIASQLNALSASFPVLEVAPNLLRLASNSFSVPKITAALSKGIAIDRNKIPMGYFPFDEDSSDSEVAPHVIQTLVAFATQNKPHFKSDEITQDMVGSLWEHFGPQKKKKLVNKVKSILGKAQVRELSGFLKRNEELWALSYSFANSPAFPTRRLNALSKQCKLFVKRLRDEERAEGRQLPLFVLG
ncbi:MAG: hypothetical protein NTZ04_02115 [Chloroflexi bacterium]|nr:hypothetical protein [Chloroflexota bacterium]